MKFEIFETKEEMADATAKKAVEILKEVITSKGYANFIAATGKSQFKFLENLTKDSSIMFHLDEYIGLLETHPASFRRYLKERFIDKVHPGTVCLTLDI